MGCNVVEDEVATIEKLMEQILQFNELVAARRISFLQHSNQAKSDRECLRKVQKALSLGSSTISR